jgi:uncharacterized phiE125 gp8 family phage protein
MSDVITLAVAKRYLRVSGTEDDTLIQTDLLEAAEAQIAAHCNVAFTEASHVDHVDGGGVSLYVSTYPVISITSIYDEETEDTLSTDEYHLWGNSQIIRHDETRWDNGRERFQVTYVGGYGGSGASSIAVPAAFREIVLQWVYRAYHNRGGMESEGAADWRGTYRAWSRTDLIQKLAALKRGPRL